jgi:hypothetical protein
VRVLAGVIVVMALVLGIVPQFVNCEARGGTMPGVTAGSGTAAASAMSASPAAGAVKPKMKCLWTARAEIAVAVPLFVIGALLLIGRRKETRRVLALPAAALGAVAMLLPTVLIGVCASPGAVCRTSLLPTALIAGSLTVAASLAILFVNELRPYGPTAAVNAG